MPKKIAKAYEISNARINFVSLVNKAANKHQFLIVKADDGNATFQTFGRIVKADTESHYVTGIVYEPMVEDSQGNYMTEEEIAKAAHWFMKNEGSVDIQHCFKKADGCEVVESYVAKSDMEIDGQPIKKGTWLMTMEISNADVWDSISKGDITGYSMGGVGAYSLEDVELPVEKQEEPKGIFKKLAKAMGFEVVEKGAVKNRYNRRIKSDNFYTAWSALSNVLDGEKFNPETGQYEYGYTDDEDVIRAALSDFNDIVTNLLTGNVSIVKSLEKAAKEAPAPIIKAGKSLSSKNLSALKGIHESLGSFLSDFEEEPENNINKEDDTMTHEEVQNIVGEEVKKAMEPIAKQLEAITKSAEPITPETATPETGDVSADSIAKMVGEEVQKAMEPVTKMLEPLMKSRSLPGNLNDAPGSAVTKSEAEPHYMTGMF
nr:MAG TPA: serine protease [Caudoviricetes sp.]